MFQIIDNDTFDPAVLSLEDNAFLIDHLGEPVEQATAKGVPAGVTPASGLRALDELYRYGKRCEANGDPFVGFEALKEACRVFLREHASMMQNARRGVAPKFPSLSEWDAFGQPHRGGVGSDSERMRSYFDAEGNRHFFVVKLMVLSDARPEWLLKKQAKTTREFKELIEDTENGVFTCPICKFSQNYEPGSRGRRSMARTRMGKHLKGAKREPDLHRQLYSYVFGS
jgi:hypothetical protein